MLAKLVNVLKNKLNVHMLSSEYTEDTKKTTLHYEAAVELVPHFCFEQPRYTYQPCLKTLTLSIILKLLTHLPYISNQCIRYYIKQ